MTVDDRSRAGTTAAPSPSAVPGVGAELLAETRRLVLRLQELPGALHQLDEQGLAELLQCLLVAGERCESMTALGLADAVSRGMVADSTAANPAQLVQRLGGGESVADVLGQEKAAASGPLVPLNECDEASVETGACVDGDGPGTGGWSSHGASARQHDRARAAEQARVCGLATGVAPGRASSIAKVADSLRLPEQEAVIGAALREGRTSVGCAGTALREADRIQPVLPAASRGEVLGWFLQLGPGATPKELKNLGRMVIAAFGDENCLDDHDEKLRTASSLRWSDLPGGMTRFIAELAPTEAAMFKKVIEALADPDPDHPHANPGESGESGRPGTTDAASKTGRSDESGKSGPAGSAGGSGPSGAAAVDDRPVERRRADALAELLAMTAQMWESSTYRAAHGKAPLDKDSVTGRATLVVRTDVETLFAHLRGRGTTGDTAGDGSEPAPGCGCGVTLSGDVLPRSTVQLIGCDGNLTVITKTQTKTKNGIPVAYGRRGRLFTGALRTLIVDRDRCCTFPGCGRPPDWCQVHHIDPWEAGGQTTYENGTLLCQRHHTVVHSRQLTADLIDGRIVWDLRRGRMLRPGQQRQTA